MSEQMQWQDDLAAAVPAEQTRGAPGGFVVVWPRTTEEVSAVLRVASRQRVPVVARGGGTSLTGGSLPSIPGIVLALDRMNAIRAVDVARGTAVVEAGVINADLQRAAAEVGLFYPPDPASMAWSTLGGNAACNAGGPHCLKYGVTRHYILGMTVVLANGDVLHLGGALLKQATGYPLLQLFIGSEGTLGIITELTVRLIPRPTAHATLLTAFASLAEASRAVVQILTGPLPAAAEVLDAVTIRALAKAMPDAPLADVGALLLLEYDGNDAEAVAREADAARQAATEAGALWVQAATEASERERLWGMRRAASLALVHLRPSKLGEDIVVPRDRIPDMVAAIGDLSAQFGLPIAVFGHIGDGNLHPNMLFDAADPSEVAKVHEAGAAILRAALRLGGQLSGEHGIGQTKRPYLREAVGAVAYAHMLALKDLFDPLHILNPGKMLVLPGETALPVLLPRNDAITG